MRRDKWDCFLDRLIQVMGSEGGKRRFREVWGQAGERMIENYEAEQRLRDTLRVLDAVR